MSNKTKLVPKLQSAWSPIVRTEPLTLEEIEIQNTLQNLYKNTEDLRNGDYDRQLMQIKQEQEQAKKDKRRQAFSNAMLTINMGENAPVAIASGYGYDENGNIGLYYVNDPGVAALRNNLAVLGATGAAVMAPQAVTALAPVAGETLAAIPAKVASEKAILAPILKEAGKDVLVGMFAADAANAGSRTFTGKSLDLHIAESKLLRYVPISDEARLNIAGTLNPAGWFSLALARALRAGLSSAFNSGMTRFENSAVGQYINLTGSNIIRKVDKMLRAPQRLKQFDLNAEEYLKQLKLDRDAFIALRDAMDRLIDEALSFFQTARSNDSKMKELSRDILRQYRDHPIPEHVPFPSWNMRYSSVDFSKFVDPQYNPNAAKYVKDLVYENGNYYIKTGLGLKYDLTTGDITLPKFGTNETLSFKLEGGTSEMLEPITNHSTKHFTTLPPIDLGTTDINVPKEYIEILRHNIDYVLNSFPGARVFGSAAGVVDAGLPHATHDIDVYITDLALALYEAVHGKVPWKDGLEGLTKEAKLDGGIYGEAGNIDLNIIATKEDGTLDFTSDRSMNIFRQLYPKEFNAALHAASGDRAAMYYPMQAQDVLDGVSVLNSIMDAFESGKPKHRSRALWYLNHGDVDLVYEALIKHGESLVGPNMKHAPVEAELFTDVNQNLILLGEMRLHGLEDLTSIAKDPKRMKLMFEYWWLNNTIFSRGTSVENMPERKAIELGVQHIRSFDDFALRNSTEWSGGIGGNVSGTGLNTVKFGDSGGGVNGNDIYVQLQPLMYGFTDGLSPMELVDLVNKNYPNAMERLPNPRDFKGIPLYTYQNILDLKDDITPAELDQLGKELRIRGIVGGTYGDSRYVGLLSPVTQSGDVVFINPAGGRHGKYPHPTNETSRHLLQGRIEKPVWFDGITNSFKHSDADRKLFQERNKPVRLILRKIRDLAESTEREVTKYRGIHDQLMENRYEGNGREINDQINELNSKISRVEGYYFNKNKEGQVQLVPGYLVKVSKLHNKFRSNLTKALAAASISPIPFGAAQLIKQTKETNKESLDFYLNNYNLSQEQLEVLEHLKNNKERLKLLRAWSDTGVINIKQ